MKLQPRSNFLAVMVNVVIMVFFICNYYDRATQSKRALEHIKESIMPDDPRLYNPKFLGTSKEYGCITLPKLHDSRPEANDVYIEKIRSSALLWGKDREYPEIRIIDDPKLFIEWGRDPRARVWNDEQVVECAFEDRTSIWFETCGFIAPRDWMRNQETYVTLHGNHILSHSWFESKNFGHFVHDHLPNIAWMRAVLPTTSKFILSESELARNIIRVLDPEFLDRIVWVPLNQVIQVDGLLTVAVPDKNPTAMETKLMQFLRKWIMEKHPIVPQERTIIYYTRKGPNTAHARLVDDVLENELIAIIKNKMEEYGRSERLVIYDGSKDGNTMSFEEQFELFRSATVAIGPHGSGLANVLWMYGLSSDNCEDRPKVLEFLVGPGSDQVQPGNYGRTYYLTYSGLPFEYHHVHYATNSTDERTFVNITDFEDAIDAVFDNSIHIQKTNEFNDPSDILDRST